MFKKFCVTLVAIAAAIIPAKANEWPSKQVTIVAPFPAGGTADLFARLIAEHLHNKFKQPFIVEDKPGAGGSIGAAQVAKAAPDGYTFLVGSVATHSINPFVYAKLPFDPDKDFVPVTLVAQLPNLLVVNPNIPAKTLPELIEYCKANPDKLTFGSAGSGTSQQLSGELFKIKTGTKITHVPYRGSPEIMQAVVGGQITMTFNNMTGTWPLAKAGKVRAIAVTSLKRSPSAPDVPTVAETIPGFDASAWFGLFAPANTPRPIVEKMAAEVRIILEKPEVISKLNELGAAPEPNTPDEFAAFITKDRAKWKEVVQTAGIKAE